jgi:periplasmic divalent cation tolerance protein
MNAIIVTTTSENRDQLNVIAAKLLEARLAACCQVIGPHTSIYRWKERIETAAEWMCLIKTRRELFEPVANLIESLHSYEVPEIIATEVVAGNDSYLKWLFEETA